MLARTRPQRQNTQAIGVPAPVNGIVATSIYGEEGALGMESALWLYNMLPTEYGCRVRPGSREFATGLTTGVTSEVRTLMYFNSVIAGGSDDRYFAATDEGIFDITNGGTSHAKVLDWETEYAGGAGGNAGWCSYVNYTNVAGDHFLLVCDEKNGYFIYDGTLGTWEKGTAQGTPKPDPQDLVQITEWQGRLWFVERDTARAWYLDPLSLQGDFTPLDVGSRFLKGGHLVQTTTWTIDDGAGMDDNFVMISSSGDLLVWAGTDPGSAETFKLIGRWQIGVVPEGRRVMSEWGGDVVIISGLGVTKLSTLLGGTATINEDSYVTKNITRYFRNEVALTSDYYGWSAEFIPGGDAAVFSVPQPTGTSRQPIQFAYSITSDAWSLIRGWDMVCQERHNDGYFFGTSDGRVMRVAGNVDNVRLGTDKFNSTWVNQGTGLGAPPVGFWDFNGATILTISYTDNVAGGWQEQLLALQQNSRIVITDQADATKAFAFSVLDDPIDGGTYASISVTLVSTGTGGSPAVDAICDVSVVPYAAGDAIVFSLLTHYTHMGSPASWKRPQFVRPAWIGDAQPTYKLKMRYDFDLTEVTESPPSLDANLALWDTALWDVNTWSGTAQSYYETIGVSGMGRHLAIAMQGKSSTDLSLVGFDIMFDGGGLL